MRIDDFIEWLRGFSQSAEVQISIDGVCCMEPDLGDLLVDPMPRHHLAVAEIPTKMLPVIGAVLSKDQYTDKILSQLKNLPIAVQDMPTIIRTIHECFENGFSDVDGLRYVYNTEEVSPNLDEDTAMRNMVAIRQKYPDSPMCKRILKPIREDMAHWKGIE